MMDKILNKSFLRRAYECLGVRTEFKSIVPKVGHIAFNLELSSSINNRSPKTFYAKK